MNKPIIIDGVDVSECAYYAPNDGIFDCNCEMEISLKCLENLNCYYKQFQRLESENEELKKAKDEYYLNNLSYEIKLSELTQALEEIRKIAKDAYENDSEYQATGVYNEILQKINEVLNEQF